MRAKIDKKRLDISVPLLEEPRRSSSGKSVLVATSRGFRKTSFKIKGKTVYVSACAYIRECEGDSKK